MISKKEKMRVFWSNRAKLFRNDPKANTNDLWLREIEINFVNNILKSHSFKRVMDFGCANGYSTFKLARLNKKITFIGIDINNDMINIANKSVKKENSSNVFFRQFDILKDGIFEKYDFIYAIRVFQNIESYQMQKRVFDKLYGSLKKNGMLLYIESYADGYKRLNADRVKIHLPPLPIHSHLTLLTDEFDNYVSQKMKLIEEYSLSSSYYLITRLLYSYIAKMNNEKINYNHPIHQVAAIIPQIGDYGPQKASLYQKI